MSANSCFSRDDFRPGTFLVAVALIVFTATSVGHGQAAAPGPQAAPPGDVVVGSGNFSPIVQDLDKAIDFYGNLLGLTVLS